MVDKIADVIIKWNTKMTYKNRGGEKGKEGNCQDFVDEILEAVGVDKKAIYQGAMGAYFERLKKKGKGGMKFFMDDSKLRFVSKRQSFFNSYSSFPPCHGHNRLS